MVISLEFTFVHPLVSLRIFLFFWFSTDRMLYLVGSKNSVLPLKFPYFLACIFCFRLFVPLNQIILGSSVPIFSSAHCKFCYQPFLFPQSNFLNYLLEEIFKYFLVYSISL